MKIAVGIDMGGTNTKFVLASENGKVLCSHKILTSSLIEKNSKKSGKLLLTGLKDFLEGESAKDVISKYSGISGIGIGIAGLIDRGTGTVIKSPNIPELNDFPLKEVFEKKFEVPVAVENDSNVYAYGEKWIGAGKEFNNFIVLTLGTGLGGGYVYKGRLFEGPMEVGHMVIVPNGRYCTCGSYGCLESYVSGRAIVDRVISSLEKGSDSLLVKCCNGNFYKITPEIIYQAALDGDNLSREVLREAGQFLGLGIANLVNVLGPEAVIIGGGLTGAWEMLFEEINREMSKRAFKPLLENLKIMKSDLMKDAGAIGAAGFLFSKIAASQAGKTSHPAS